VKDCNVYKSWIEDIGGLIHIFAPHHLVSLGNEGTITECAKEGGSMPQIDYLTFHCWA
jgi:hypothetical protein